MEVIVYAMDDCSFPSAYFQKIMWSRWSIFLISLKHPRWNYSLHCFPFTPPIWCETQLAAIYSVNLDFLFAGRADNLGIWGWLRHYNDKNQSKHRSCFHNSFFYQIENIPFHFCNINSCLIVIAFYSFKSIHLFNDLLQLILKCIVHLSSSWFVYSTPYYITLLGIE